MSFLVCYGVLSPVLPMLNGIDFYDKKLCYTIDEIDRRLMPQLAFV